MTVSKEQAQEIRRLFNVEKWPVGTIATQLGVHVDVVTRIIESAAGKNKYTRKARATKLAPYRDFITETLRQYPRLLSTRIYDMISSRGYKGSVRTVRSFVKAVRPVPQQEAYLRIHPLIGEQAQIDWAHVSKVAVPGGVRGLYLFVMVLAWSRGIWAEFVMDLGVDTLLRSLVRAAAFFKGTCRQWLFDNPKAVVLERYGDKIRFHPLLVDLADEYQVQCRACAVRKPNQKGCVERAIRFMRGRFLAGRTIVDMDQGNAELQPFLREIANARPHPEFRKRSVWDCIQEEQSYLLPLPKHEPSTDLMIPVTVTKQASVRFDKNSYSVPPTMVGKSLSLVADEKHLRLLDGMECIAQHPRCWGIRQTIEAPEHRKQLIELKRRARESTGRTRLQAALPGIDTIIERWVVAGRNVGCVTSQTLHLLDLYGEDICRSAVQALLARETSDPGALAQLCEQERRRRHQPVPLDIPLAQHIKDREVIPHDLERYDGKKDDSI